MSIVRKYILTLGLIVVAGLIFLSFNFHYESQIQARHQNISRFQRPKEVKQAHTLTGKAEQPIGQFTLQNDNEKRQVAFAQNFLTNHFSYNTSDSYAQNRSKSQKEMTPQLWNRVKGNEFSDQKNRIGESIIDKDRSTSNFISAEPYIALDTLPERNMTAPNVPIYYLVTSSYTDNKDDNAENGKQVTLIKMSVNADKSLVSDYQVLGRSNF